MQQYVLCLFDELLFNSKNASEYFFIMALFLEYVRQKMLLLLELNMLYFLFYINLMLFSIMFGGIFQLSWRHYKEMYEKRSQVRLWFSYP